MKKYAKYLLLHKDRRFAKDASFIFFVADYLEKLQLRNYVRRVIHQKYVNRITIDQLFRFDVNSNMTYIREDITSGIPHTIRSSYEYKRKSFLDLMCLFRTYREPQLFMTFTCNDFSEDMLGAVDTSEPWSDPVLFAQHFKNKWTHFFQNIIKGKWANKIGGINHFYWVLELQERGSPHIHILLWTKKTAAQLAELDIITTELPPLNTRDRELVARHQIHKCGTYCRISTIDGDICRFNFPQEEREENEEINGRYHFKRTAQAAMVNQYNPYFLHLLECNMDIQLNVGYKALAYLCKYLIEFDTVNNYSLSEEANGANINIEPLPRNNITRHMVVIEAVYDIMGWHKEQSSVDVIFLNTNLPENQRRCLKTLAQMEGDYDIVHKTHLEKYLTRPVEMEDITLPQMFTEYRPATKNDKRHAFVSATHPKEKYVKRKRPCLHRTRCLSMSAGEAYYFQQILLHLKVRSLDVNDFGTYRAAYQHYVTQGQIQPRPFSIKRTTIGYYRKRS